MPPAVVTEVTKQIIEASKDPGLRTSIVYIGPTLAAAGLAAATAPAWVPLAAAGAAGIATYGSLNKLNEIGEKNLAESQARNDAHRRELLSHHSPSHEEVKTSKIERGYISPEMPKNFFTGQPLGVLGKGDPIAVLLNSLNVPPNKLISASSDNLDSDKSTTSPNNSSETQAKNRDAPSAESEKKNQGKPVTLPLVDELGNPVVILLPSHFSEDTLSFKRSLTGSRNYDQEIIANLTQLYKFYGAQILDNILAIHKSAEVFIRNPEELTATLSVMKAEHLTGVTDPNFAKRILTTKASTLKKWIVEKEAWLKERTNGEVSKEEPVFNHLISWTLESLDKKISLVSCLYGQPVTPDFITEYLRRGNTTLSGYVLLRGRILESLNSGNIHVINRPENIERNFISKYGQDSFRQVDQLLSPIFEALKARRKGDSSSGRFGVISDEEIEISRQLLIRWDPAAKGIRDNKREIQAENNFIEYVKDLYEQFVPKAARVSEERLHSLFPGLESARQIRAEVPSPPNVQRGAPPRFRYVAPSTAETLDRALSNPDNKEIIKFLSDRLQQLARERDKETGQPNPAHQTFSTEILDWTRGKFEASGGRLSLRVAELLSSLQLTTTLGLSDSQAGEFLSMMTRISTPFGTEGEVERASKIEVEAVFIKSRFQSLRQMAFYDAKQISEKFYNSAIKPGPSIQLLRLWINIKEGNIALSEAALKLEAIERNLQPNDLRVARSTIKNMLTAK